MNARRAAWAAVSVVVVLLAGLAVGLVYWLNVRGDPPAGEPLAGTTESLPAQVARGAYLAKVGNCAGCHTLRGGLHYAGGRGIETPFGIVYSSNLTPDPATGIGSWSATDFWRALHNGRAKDGRLLYPAFPYPNYAQVTRDDADALFAFLCSLAPVVQADRPHELRFPYDRQATLAVWRALFFRPAVFAAQPDKTPPWNRGAYLVRGLGHCVACHSTRNALGATAETLELAGGLIPVQKWYAPSLASADEASVAHWKTEEVEQLLATGTTARGSVLGPMAEVVFESTQYLDAPDLRAMAVFLRDLPQARPGERPATAPQPAPTGRGAALYKNQCQACHGDAGQGSPGAYPSLAGNRKVTMASAANLIHVVAEGGFAPATHGNPRPYGMPPFRQSLGDADIAAVITFIRNSWGNEAGPVSELDVLRAR